MLLSLVGIYLMVRLLHGVASFRSFPTAIDELKLVSNSVREAVFMV